VAPPGNEAETEDTNLDLWHWKKPVYLTQVLKGGGNSLTVELSVPKRVPDALIAEPFVVCIKDNESGEVKTVSKKWRMEMDFQRSLVHCFAN